MKITIGAPRVLGIELDNGIARVVEMEFKSKTPKIYNAFTVPAPKNIITQEGLVQESEEFRTAFLDTLSRLKISADHIAFSISSSRIINREITIPNGALANGVILFDNGYVVVLCQIVCQVKCYCGAAKQKYVACFSYANACIAEKLVKLVLIGGDAAFVALL